MGDPKFQRKKYETPKHPWQRDRIEEERIILKEYGLKNKKEIWKMVSLLRSFSNQVKKLIAAKDNQAEKEKALLLKRLHLLGLIKKTAQLDDILSLTQKDIMERRLQTIVHRKGLAKSMKQARQFIVHGHIKIKDKKMTIPSYSVKKEEEDFITFVPKSTLANPDHPERVIQKKESKKSEKITEKSEKVSKTQKTDKTEKSEK